MIDLSSEAAFTVSRRLRVLTYNQKAERIIGLSAKEAIGRSCADVVRAEWPSGEPLCGLACEGRQCFASGVPFSVQRCLARRSDGSGVVISLSTMIIPEGASGAWHPDARAVVFLHQPDADPAKSVVAQPLRIYALGRFELVLNGQPIRLDKWERKSALTVLKLLAMRLGRAVNRYSLAESLWPGVEEKPGRDRLKVAIHYLRHRLDVANLISFTGEGYALHRDLVWVDAREFERLVAEGSRRLSKDRLDEAAASFSKAVEIYRGDFLEENAYDDWCTEERERLREVFFDAVDRLACALVSLRRFEAAADACRIALAREPCRESFHCILMACLLQMGRLGEAELQFRRCREALARDLAVEPLPETLRLYQRIREARSEPAAAARSWSVIP